MGTPEGSYGCAKVLDDDGVLVLMGGMTLMSCVFGHWIGTWPRPGRTVLVRRPFWLHRRHCCRLLPRAPRARLIWLRPFGGRSLVPIRCCHGYIPEDWIRALYPYPLWTRAGDAYPKCTMRKGGEDISILSDRKFAILSDPYPRYEIPDTGIYTVMSLPAPGEFWINRVDLSFHVPTIGGLMSEHLAATSGDPARPTWNRSITRLDPIALMSECHTRFRTVILTSIYTNGREPPRRRPLRR